ncbi:hypothetical protein [Alteribacillus iranensis]|uniref:Uncharacterized protein n=1 Tax=Alteribacillus iranensis TaxID=930128 RepID=A0A1I2B3X7_9BACI|nr:hypothetical protein [Alteribacillus iranensis]SFE50885.1 hypothetical protein SAMN05192532_10271 [Alteribacillus iranensis]
MNRQVTGFDDMNSILRNERKVGGVIESDYLRLTSGEEYENVVVTKVELIGSAVCSMTCVTEDGQTLMVNVKEVSLIHQPQHKKICELNNEAFKHRKMQQKLKYLKRLFELNEDSLNPLFLEEAMLLIEDIGLKNVHQEVDVSSVIPEDKIYTIA